MNIARYLSRRVSPRIPAGRANGKAFEQVALALLLALPALLTAFLAFNEGGFFPGSQAFVVVVLLVALAARVAFARNPLEGFGRPVAIGAGALALLALWTLVSAARSDSTWRALVEFDRVLLYLTALLLFASVARTPERVRWMVRLLAIALAVICTAALATRLLPDVFPTAPNISNERLSYPLTYWNALGMVATLGIVFCLQLACRAREPAIARVLGAAAIPLLATTLYFTFSRGAIIATIVGVAGCLVLGRSRGTLSGLVAIVPTTVVALTYAYDADLLATPEPTTAAAAAQGHDLARVVLVTVAVAALVRAVMLLVDRRLARVRISDRLRARVVRPFWAAAGIALLVGALAVGAPSYVEEQYESFASGDQQEFTGDFRERLTDPGSPSRLRQWEVARAQFAAGELAGQGAGTYEFAWARDRPTSTTVVDAHSLYQEQLGELGIVGLVLLLTGLLAILAGFGVRMRGSDRPVYAALLAAGLAWTVHAGIDWDWEMPAVTIWLFALGGAALARSKRRRRRTPDWTPIRRVPIVLALIALALLPTLIARSQGQLQDADAAFAREDCDSATQAAEASIGTLSLRPEPNEILAYCAIRRGDARAAVARMEDAIEGDPHNWNYHYSLAVAQAAAGLDPRAEARKALRLNPRDPLVRDAVRRFNTSDRRRWIAEGTDLAASFSEL